MMYFLKCLEGTRKLPFSYFSLKSRELWGSIQEFWQIGWGIPSLFLCSFLPRLHYMVYPFCSEKKRNLTVALNLFRVTSSFENLMKTDPFHGKMHIHAGIFRLISSSSQSWSPGRNPEFKISVLVFFFFFWGSSKFWNFLICSDG